MQIRPVNTFSAPTGVADAKSACATSCRWRHRGRVAFDRLALDDPLALDLLTVAAWCGPEPIPLGLLTDHPDALPRQLQPIATDPLVLARCTSGAYAGAAMITRSRRGFQLGIRLPGRTHPPGQRHIGHVLSG